ncbi:MAG: hypothetical protein ACIALR_04115 [Blastopirellula sp. JB062]
MSRHALTAGACLLGTLGWSTYASATEAPIAPLTEEELATEAYQVEFRPPARDGKDHDNSRAEGKRPGSEARGKHGRHAKRPEGRGHDSRRHPRFDRPHFDRADFDGRPERFMRYGAMRHRFGPKHEGFAPGRDKSHHAGPHFAIKRQQMRIDELERKVDRLARAFRADKSVKGTHHPGRRFDRVEKPGFDPPHQAIHRLKMENEHLKHKVARLEIALKSHKSDDKKGDRAHRPDFARPHDGPMMRGGPRDGFAGRRFEGMHGERGPIARGPRDGQRRPHGEMDRPRGDRGPRDGDRPKFGPRDEDRRERKGDRRDDRRSENSSPSREGFAWDADGDGINDSPVVEVAVVEAP